MKQFFICFLLATSTILSHDISVLIDRFYLKSFVAGSPLLLSDNSGVVARLNKGVKFTLGIVKNSVSVTIQNKSFSDSALYLSPDNPENKPDPQITISEHTYKGTLKFSLSDGKLFMVNVLQLDEYLKGVIPYEMPVRDFKDYEALKAFCVVARSYTLMKMRESKGPYDVTGSVNDQVFKGEKEPNPLYNMALSATTGQYITYRNAPVVIFYHACCGGHTENSDNVFNKLNIPYLKGVADEFCSIAPSYQWKQEVRASELKARTKFKTKSVSEIRVESKLSSGRLNSIELIFEDGSTQIVTAKSIRSFFTDISSGALMRSSLIETIEKQTESDNDAVFVFRGKGNGHGVGFCQWGAIGQSRMNKSYKEIIEFYFPDTEVLNENNP